MTTRNVQVIAASVLIAAGAATACAQGPKPVVPAGYEPPGPYPTTVTGAVLNIRNVAVPQEPDQGGEDNMFFEVPGSGPFHWTSSRNNGGDFGLNIGPFYGPDDSRSYPPQPADNYAAGNEGTTYAWRLSYATGVSFAVPRSNGAFGQFTYNGQPIVLRYTASIGNSSTAQGYSMYSGFHTVEEPVQTYGCDLQLGCAGIPDRQEAVGNAAVAYFPFEQGWIGGHWDYAANDWQDGIAASPGLLNDVVVWQKDVSFQVTLPGIDSASDGMLLVNSTQTNSNLKIIGAYPNNGGWTVYTREDDDIDLTGTTPPDDLGINFSFVYVPWEANGLIGAHVQGATGGVYRTEGNYSLFRSSEGRYMLQIPGRTDTDGALMITGCGLMAGTEALPDRTFFSYQFIDGFFVIESREIVPNSSSPWGRSAELRDSDFYFVWVDFVDPLEPDPAPGCPADWNRDSVLNSQDFFDFLNDFFDGDADYNMNKTTDSQDFFDFLTDFFIGC